MKLKCENPNCKHESQDKLHGPGVRVHNETKPKAGTAPIYRCTVCARERRE